MILNADRAEFRRRYRILDALNASKSASIDRAYFHAMTDDAEEAEAMFNLHQARVEYEQELTGSA